MTFRILSIEKNNDETDWMVIYSQMFNQKLHLKVIAGHGYKSGDIVKLERIENERQI